MLNVCVLTGLLRKLQSQVNADPSSWVASPSPGGPIDNWQLETPEDRHIAAPGRMLHSALHALFNPLLGNVIL